jgi:hypothetical protein
MNLLRHIALYQWNVGDDGQALVYTITNLVW